MSKRERGLIEERLNQCRAPTHVLGLSVDLVDQFIQVKRAIALQCMALEVPPNAFVGIEFWSVGRKPVDRQSWGKASKSFLSQLGFVRTIVIPEQAYWSVDVAEQVPDEADRLRCLDGALNQLHIYSARRRHPGDGGEFRPIAAVVQDRSLAPGCPSPTTVRGQREAAFIYEDQCCLKGVGFFLASRQVVRIQRLIFLLFRSRACSFGTWQLHFSATRIR